MASSSSWQWPRRHAALYVRNFAGGSASLHVISAASCVVLPNQSRTKEGNLLSNRGASVSGLRIDRTPNLEARAMLYRHSSVRELSAISIGSRQVMIAHLWHCNQTWDCLLVP